MQKQQRYELRQDHEGSDEETTSENQMGDIDVRMGKEMPQLEIFQADVDRALLLPQIANPVGVLKQKEDADDVVLSSSDKDDSNSNHRTSTDTTN